MMDENRIAWKRRILLEEYPMNILKAIKDDSDRNLPDEITEENRSGLKCALSTLTEREQNILRYRYVDRLSLAEIGVIIGVNVERIRQIESHALRELRKHKNWYMIEFGLEGYIKRRCELEYERAYQIGYTDGYKDGVKEANEGITKPGISVTITSLPIEALELSKRAYNTLTMAGYKCIGDLIAISDKRKITGIKNFGIKQRAEVAEGLKRFGILKEPWDYYYIRRRSTNNDEHN